MKLKIISLILIIFSSAAMGRYSVGVFGNAEYMVACLADNGFSAECVTNEGICENGSLNKYNCIVIVDANNFPAAGRSNLLKFLKSGSDMVLLGKAVNFLDLPVFDDRDVYYFKNVPVVTAYKEQNIIKPDFKITGNFSGLSAIAFEYPDVSRYVPLLEVQDKYSRRQGFAAGMLVNHSGKFKNSQWLLFGIDSPEFYRNSECLDTIVKVLNKFKEKSLPAKFAKKDRINKNSRLKIVSPEPDGFIKLSKDGKHFVLPNGRKFFALGCNYIGPFERKCEFGEDYFNLQRIEEDFKKAKEAGINTFRIWQFRIDLYPDRFKTLMELARKYQIYLLLQPREHPLATDKQHIKVFENTVEIAGDETIVLGYDLMNEPYITMMGSTSIDGKQTEILKHKTYEKYSNDYFDRKWVDDTVREKGGWPEIGTWLGDKAAKNLYAAYSMFKRYIEKYNSANDYSCLYGLDGKLPIEANYAPFISAVDETVSDWILFQKNVINKLDKNHFVTVGYNTSLAAMPANKQLDFTSHHIYQMPYSYEDVQKSVTTFDRLRAFWPNKPITLGEFGFSSGIKMPDGKYLGTDAGSVAEMMVYLHAFANDYSGAYLWMLSEWPVANMKHNAHWISVDRQIYESRFGMYYYDGTSHGHPKPIMYATKFFREYIDSHNPGDGKLKIMRADTPMQAGYVFTDKDALFAGNTKYNSKRLEFQSDLPVNVMLMWNAEQLKIMATRDVEVKIKMLEFGFSKDTDFDADGLYDSFVKDGDTISLKLLEGQPVTFLIKGK